MGVWCLSPGSDIQAPRQQLEPNRSGKPDQRAGIYWNQRKTAENTTDILPTTTLATSPKQTDIGRHRSEVSSTIDDNDDDGDHDIRRENEKSKCD